ncbi:MAG: DNA adenine methylase [Chamaesiphon sp.]
MKQLSLFGDKYLDQLVNVASVSQRSSFRYPGGKTWLVPRIRQWLYSLQRQPVEFIEPFAGGGIVSLTVAFEQLAERVMMVELDDQVAAVWQTILTSDGEWLANEIAAFELSPEAVASVLSIVNPSLREKAFQAILRNRINRGGILAAGAGQIKSGENGRGIRSRWYPETLKRRILAIATIRDHITFIASEGLKLLSQNTHRADAVFFIDPPYTSAGKKAGSRLYTHSELDHEELFRIASGIAGDLLMTYDDAPEVRQLARKYGFNTQTVAMKNTHHAKMTELLIGRNLDWLR